MSETTRRGADPALMREINAVTTLRALHNNGAAMTLSEITAATGLARRTVEVAVERLVSDGLAIDLPPASTGRPVGRPARSFRFKARAGYVLGLDISVRMVTALLADLAGEVVGSSKHIVDSSAGRSERIATAVRAAEACFAEAGVDAASVWATTAGTPGLVTDSSWVDLCWVMPEWSEFALAHELADGLPGPVEVENDANLSAVAERWQGAAQDVDNMVWVLTGRRSKAAVLIDGKLYRGADGAAGEIGWLPELGWSRVSERAPSLTESPPVGEATESTIYQAMGGDRQALDELDAYAALLAPGLTALTLALNPRCLVIGGGIAAAGDAVLPAISTHMKPHCLRLPDLRMSTLGPDSVALGAIRQCLDRVEHRLFATARPMP